MAKKSNKTAHVLSLLTNGTSDLIEEDREAREERLLNKEPTPVEQRTPAEPTKKEVVVQLPDSEEDDLLSNLIKGDLQKELDKQVRSKQDELQSQEEDINPHQRPPYSPTFMSLFGQHTTADSQTKKSSLSQDKANDVPHTAEPQQTPAESNQPSRERTQNKVPSKGAKNQLPTSLSQVRSELYILEDFDDEQERRSLAAPQPSSNLSKGPSAMSSSGYPPAGLDHRRVQQADSKAKGAAMYQHPAQVSQPIPGGTPIYGQATYGKPNRVLHNFAEDILLAQAPPIMQSFNMCICQDCLYDVVTVALNNIKPMYFMVPPEQFSAKLTACQQQYSEELNSQLAKACIKVKLDPSHPRHPAPPR